MLLIPRSRVPRAARTAPAWRRRTALVTTSVLALGLTTAGAANAGTKDFRFEFVNGTIIEGSSDDNTAFLAGAGGTDPDNPIGMEIHVSCSDDFPNGFGEKDGPDPVRDSAWQIASYSIFDDGDLKCGDAFTPAPPPGGTGEPSIDIEKSVNGQDADNPTGPVVAVGSTVTFGYVVTNDGGQRLTDVKVVDNTLGPVDCPKTTLAVDESMTCDEKTEVVTSPGQMTMDATVTGNGSLTAAVPSELLNTQDEKAFQFVFVNGTVISGTSDDNTKFLPNAGGTSVDNPIGMEVHVSCSDEFPGGFGEKDGPDRVRDSAWQIASFQIAKIKDGDIDKICGDVFQSSNVEVTDTDPVNFLAERDVVVPPPSVCVATVNPDGTVDVSWSAVDGATRYGLNRNGDFLASLKGTRFVDFAPPANATYMVRAQDVDGNKSIFVTCEQDDTPPPPPTTIDPPAECTATRDGDRVTIRFSTVDGATRYAIRRNGKFLVSLDGTSFVDVAAPAGATYQVLAANGATKSALRDCPGDTPPPPVDEPPAPPTSCTATIEGDQVTLVWDRVPDASSYSVRRNGRFLASVKGTSYVEAPALAGATYAVRAINGNGKSTDTPCETDGTPPPPTTIEPPADCTATPVAGGIEISFSRVDGATRYAIWRNGTFVKSTRSTSYVDADGDRYDAYTVRSSNDDGVKSDFARCKMVSS